MGVTAPGGFASFVQRPCESWNPLTSLEHLPEHEDFRPPSLSASGVLTLPQGLGDSPPTSLLSVQVLPPQEGFPCPAPPPAPLIPMLSGEEGVYVPAPSLQSCLDSLRPHGVQHARLLCPWGFPGKNTGVSSHALPSSRGSSGPRD